MAKILLIDDEKDLCAFMAAALRRQGHEVVTERSGAAVVDQNGLAAAFDLIITDIVMPGVDGMEVICRIKSRSPSARMLAISGGGRYAMSDSCLRLAKGLGATATLAKPFDICELCEAVEQTLQTA
jgi:DNA-binding NtrC family response regulator